MALHKGLLAAGALLGFIAVAMGAFGAHALRDKIQPHLLNVLEIGVRYQLFHAVLIIALSGLTAVFNPSWMAGAGWLMVFGVILFSGSLYLLALTGIKQWGAVTPVGGVTLLVGWLCVVIGAWKS